jgi:integrase
MTKTKSNIHRTLAQATGGLMLATANEDLGIVPAREAAGEAADIAQQTGETVTIRDVVTDQVLAVAQPGGGFSTGASLDHTRKRPPNKRVLTELFVRKVKPRATAFVVWDLKQRGLVLRVQPSGRRSWNVIYNRTGRTRWLHLGDAAAIGLADARQLAAEAMLAVARGGDPASEKRAQRSSGTFAELADRYLEHARRVNKSWRQARALVERFALPRWGKLQASTIARSDVKALMASIQAPIVANQTLAAISAVFTWAVKEEMAAANPCKLVDRHETRSRERVLADSELPRFWSAFGEADPVIGSALKVLLLTGQRPGAVAHMRREHLKDGWWEMPGEPVPALHWPGTKNGQSRRVWLPQAAVQLIGEGATGFAFSGPRGRPIRGLDQEMRKICAKLDIERLTPHDLRRSFASTAAALYGRPAMDRLLGHADHTISSVYDRHSYSAEDQRIWETVANRFVALAEGRKEVGNVVSFR